MLNKYLNFP